MNYKFTLLRDIAGIKAGLVVKCHGLIKTAFQGICYVLEEGDSITYASVAHSPLSDPKVFRKEIDYSSLVDMKCPICGETRGILHIQLTNTGYRSDDNVLKAVPMFEYACGHPFQYIPWHKSLPDEVVKATGGNA